MCVINYYCFFFFFFLLFILAGGECLGIFIQSSLDIYYVIQQDNSSIIPLKPSQLLYRPGPGRLFHYRLHIILLFCTLTIS